MAFGKRKTPVQVEGVRTEDGMPLGQLPLATPRAASAHMDPAAGEPRNGGSAPQETDRPPRRKIIPDEVWEKHADFFAELGLSSDDESNLLPDANSVNERLDRDQLAQEAKLAEMNRSVAARVPGGSMRPFSLLPDPCWNGEMGRFLMMQLDLFPYDDWNMIFLPADEGTAEALDLPLHPNGNVPAFVESSERFLRDAQAHLHAAHDEATRTQDFRRFHDTLEEIRGKVRGLARAFLGEMDKAWENRHD
jgi:hypothetical protein